LLSYTLKAVAMSVRFVIALFRAKILRRPLVKVFFATETGVSKRFAEKVRKIFAGSFNVAVIPLDR
jgi:hypothetical protein